MYSTKAVKLLMKDSNVVYMKTRKNVNRWKYTKLKIFPFVHRR